MFYKKISFFIIITLLLFSCVAKQPIKNLDKLSVLSLVKEKNPYQCQIKSKGIFYFENKISKVKFRGYLKKSCDDEFILNVLGALNQVTYQAIFKDGKVNIFKNNKNVNRDVKAFDDSDIKLLVSILHWPLIIPDNSYKFEVTENNYIFKKYPYEIFVDKRTFKIIKVKKDKESVSYVFNGDEIKILHYINLPLELKVKFI